MAKHEIKTKISGVTFPDPASGLNRQEVIGRFVRPGTRLELRLETNEHAEGNIAVGVWMKRGCVRRREFHVGYLNEQRKREFQPALAKGVGYTATVLDVTGGTKQEPTRGVNVVIRWSD